MLLSYLFDEPIDKVTYFTLKKKKPNGMYSYTLDREKYNFVLEKFKELKMPIMSSEFSEEIFSRDTEK